MISSIILTLANLYSWIIFFYALMSWLPVHNGGILGDIYRALGTICDPYLNLFKKIIPPIGGMVDISPIIALLVLQFVVRLLVNLL